jgi:hypothetical protein
VSLWLLVAKEIVLTAAGSSITDFPPKFCQKPTLHDTKDPMKLFLTPLNGDL